MVNLLKNWTAFFMLFGTIHVYSCFRIKSVYFVASILSSKLLKSHIFRIKISKFLGEYPHTPVMRRAQSLSVLFFMLFGTIFIHVLE